jgi:Ser/Thr protein kinase RdoA (MazF antagonist)
LAFSDLTTEEQIQSLLAPASSVLLDYGITPVEIESINHEYNSTFSVTAADGGRFALRINVNSTRKKENVAAEISFVNTLAEFGKFGLATPLQNLSGNFVSQVAHEETGRDLLCVLFS